MKEMIKLALREIQTAVNTGYPVDHAKIGVEFLVWLENTSNEVHGINTKYNHEAIWRQAKKIFNQQTK